MGTPEELLAAYNAADTLRDKVSDADGPIEMIRKAEEVRRWAQNELLALHETRDKAILAGDNETIREVDQAWAQMARKGVTYDAT